MASELDPGAGMAPGIEEPMMRRARFAVFLSLLVATIAWGISPMESDQPVAYIRDPAPGIP